jgi:mRNA interferase MazF
VVKPTRGEVWLIDLNPIRGHEQGGVRPCVVVSVDSFNLGPADMAVVLPITTKNKFTPVRNFNPLLVEVKPPEGGLRQQSFIKCYDIRSVAQDRFLKKWGSVSAQTLNSLEDPLGVLLNLS